MGTMIARMRLMSAVLGFVLRKLGLLLALVLSLFLGYLLIQTLIPTLREAVADRDRLQQVSLPDCQLNRIRRGIDERPDRSTEILDAAEERPLVEEPMVDCDVEAAVRPRIEQSLESIRRHNSSERMEEG